jgi:ABC-2 type transport system permease protein
MLFMAASGHVTFHNVALAALCTLCAACVFLGMASIFYSLSFWLRRTESVSRQAVDLLLLFSIYPESLFGGALRWLLFSALPAGFVSYVPVHVLRDGKLSELPLLMLAAAGFLWLGVWVFERGLRRYASGSRFSILA